MHTSYTVKTYSTGTSTHYSAAMLAAIPVGLGLGRGVRGARAARAARAAVRDTWLEQTRRSSRGHDWVLPVQPLLA